MNKQTQLAGQNREKENKDSPLRTESHDAEGKKRGKFMALGLLHYYIIEW